MNKLYIIIASLFLSVSAQAQNLKECFIAAPDSIFMPVNQACRSTLMQMADSCTDMRTAFGDTIIVRSATDTFISYYYQGASVQLRLDDDMIVAAFTYGDECTSSEVRFYDKAWNLKSLWIYGSSPSRFMPSDIYIYNSIVEKPEEMSEDDFNRLKKYLDPMMVSAALTDVKGTVILGTSSPLLSEDEKNELNRILKQKTFKFTN